MSKLLAGERRGGRKATLAGDQHEKTTFLLVRDSGAWLKGQGSRCSLSFSNMEIKSGVMNLSTRGKGSIMWVGLKERLPHPAQLCLSLLGPCCCLVRSCSVTGLGPWGAQAAWTWLCPAFVPYWACQHRGTWLRPGMITPWGVVTRCVQQLA